MKTFKILIIALIIMQTYFLNNNLFGQDNELDSLQNVYKKAKSDTSQIMSINEIGNYYRYEDFDSALHYYNKALLITDKAIKQNIKTNKQIIPFLVKLKTALLLNIGDTYSELGEYELAINYCLQNIKIYESISIINKLEGKKGLYKSYNNIGNNYYYQGNYSKTIENYIKALKIAEEINDKNSIAKCYNNIGIIHYEQAKREKALEYHFKSLKISEEIFKENSVEGKKGMSRSYNNIALIYKDQDKFKEAIEYHLKSLKIDEELGDKQGISSCYNNIGIIKQFQGNYDEAINYYLKSLKIKEELGDKNGIVTCYINLASINISLADSVASTKQKKNKYLNKAIEYDNKAMKLAKEINAIPWENMAAKSLKQIYKKLGNFEKSLFYAELFISTNDSMFEAEKTRAITDAEKKFETEKKQLQIDKLNRENELQESKLLRQQEIGQRQKIVIIFIIFGMLLISAFSIFIVQRLRITRKQKGIIEKQKGIVDEKNEMLNQQNEEIMAQRDEIEVQNASLVEAYKTIERKNKNITDSIKYALRIQTAILPPKELINHLIPDTFVLYKPKSIVSGDFYYLDSKDEFIYFAAVDCTGHGVSGAFMSIVGYNILNQALNEKNIREPELMLNYLSESVLKTLRQSADDNTLRDGMDLSLCRLNKRTKQIKIASALSTIYIVRDKDLIEFKGEKYPIGKPFNESFTTYTSKEFSLIENDIIYLFSDGYVDQFNNENNKKFTSARFKELLIKISKLPMQEQQNQLTYAFDEWKGNSDQIDDVMVLGIKI